MSPISAQMPVSVSEELIFQFDNLFHVLSVTIRPLSRKQWTAGATPAQTPVRLACHILESIEFSATHQRDGCLRRFGVEAGVLDGELIFDKLPRPVDVLAYNADVCEAVHHWLAQMDERDFLGPTPVQGWQQRGMTLLGHILYVLRHATFHLGQMCAVLDARGFHYGVFK